MGNNITKSINKWGLNPRKFTLKRKKRKDAPVVPTHQATATNVHIYDSVPDMPVYAKVNKRRPADKDELHYADVQVLQSQCTTSRERQKPPPATSRTEYATIDFKTPVKSPIYSEPADILIPPGVLQRPMSKARRKKSSSSQGAVVV